MYYYFFSISKQGVVSRSRAVHPNKNFIQKALLLELEAINNLKNKTGFFLYDGEMFKLKNLLLFLISMKKKLGFVLAS